MKIICINGQGGVGKDTFVEFCGSEEEGVFNTSMINCIKNLATTIGWDGSKDEGDRKFLSDLKDLVAEYNDYPFKSVLDDIKQAERNYDWYSWYTNLTNELVCFVHARESKDIERWRREYGAKALLIRREEVEKTHGNHADDQVFDIDYDYVILNDGDLDCLRDKADYFIKNVRKEEWSSYIYGSNY